MRIIDIYNYIATAVCVFIGAAAVVVCKKKKENAKETGSIPDKAAYILLGLIVLVAAFLRLWKLGSIPMGLAPDEASMGYDAYAIARFGVDRNGFPYPVYPITWGPGGGSPLMIYLNVLTIKLFGTGIVKLRLLPAILGILTVPIFFGILKEISRKSSYSNELSLFGAAFLAICPWHVILTRWSLDSNIMPFTLGLALYLFMLGIRKQSTLLYCLSAGMYAVCMYSYGSATIVVPIHLLLICIICIRKKVLSIGQLIGAGVTFLVIFAPLLLFYAVNYLGLPEIVTEHFSVNKFTASRTGEVFLTPGPGMFGTLITNIKTLLIALTVGDKNEMLCHFYPGYWMLYVFTFPIVFLGIFLGARELFAPKHASETGKRAAEGAAAGSAGGAAAEVGPADGADDSDKLYAMNALWMTLLIACFVMAIVIMADASRMVMMYLPLIFFFVKGAGFVMKHTDKFFYGLCVMVLLAAVSFSKDYFRDFSDKAAGVFMPGYGDAMKRAYEMAGDERTIYSTYDGLSSPFMLALYYTEYSPVEFNKTVVYKDPDAEFRVAKSFGNFVFELPKDAFAGASIADKYDGDVFVLSSAEKEELSELPGEYTIETIGGYVIIYK